MSGVQSTVPSKLPEVLGLTEKPLPVLLPLAPALPPPSPLRVALPVRPTVGNSPPRVSCTISVACW